MKVVIQRARNAKVHVANKVVGEIQDGLVILVGFTHEDTIEDINYIVNKIVHLRIFEDENHKMNFSIKEIGGSVLSISQFTIYSDTRKGRRPSFVQAAPPEKAKKLYEKFNDSVRQMGIPVEIGRFGEMMDVQLTNVGPVTIILDSNDR